MPYVIGIDVGGTFTDVTVLDGNGRLFFDKALSTPQDPTHGVLAALEAVAEQLGMDTRAFLEQTERFCHGTTIATNALLERRGAQVGLLTTAGFEDTLVIARGPIGRVGGLPPSQAMDFLHNDAWPPLVPRSQVRGVRERVSRTGEVLVPLHRAEAYRVVRELLDIGIDGLAVCLLWSFRNPVHERLIAEVAHELSPELPISCSSEISPLLGEFERTLTTVINEFVRPSTTRYLRGLHATLADLGLRRSIQVMTCSGGLCLPEQLDRRAVAIVNSGPVGGLIAARHMGQRHGWSNVLTTDMGGTSFDVGLCVDGAYEYERAPFFGPGLPVQTSAVRVVTVGAGGGSIAWTDGRRLRVGPRSAGADPGPACYGQGGTEPTVTDALLMLGLLDAERFFGGRRRLLPAAAVAAVARVAQPLGLEPLAAARGIYEIVTARMADLVRKATIEAGLDPRRFVMLAYGGAGPAHAAEIGRGLGVQQVVVPYAGPVFSALGAAISEVRYVYSRSNPMPLEATPSFIAQYEATFADLMEHATADLASSGGREGASFTRLVDLRYAGQMNEVTVIGPDGPGAATVVDHLRTAFESLYQRRFGAATIRPGARLEMVNFRLEAVSQRRLPDLVSATSPTGDVRARSWRPVYLSPGTPLSAAVYDFEVLPSGESILGPAIIERWDTTIWVPPGQRATLDSERNVTLEVGGA